MKKRLQSIISKNQAVLGAIPTFVLLFIMWLVLTEGGFVPDYMLPSPVAVCKAFLSDMSIMAVHLKVTLIEAFGGLVIGVSVGFSAALFMDRFKAVENMVYPVLIVTQTIPTIALAPILVMWMGFEMAPKIVLIVLTTFFPIAVGVLDGFKSVDPDMINLMRSMGANEFQRFCHLKIPAALPNFFSGLKISVTYAVVGAVVSEWIGGFEGLGVYMTRVKKAYAFDKMFAVILLIVLLSLFLMFLVKVLARVSMPWIYVNKGWTGEKRQEKQYEL